MPGFKIRAPQVWKPRLVVYHPLTWAQVGILPYPTSFQVQTSVYGPSTLEVRYSLNAAHHQWIQDGYALAFEYPKYGNPTDKRPAFTEPPGCRFLPISKSQDRLDKTEMWVYRFIEAGPYLMRRVVPVDFDTPAEGEDNQDPVRSFPAPGSGASPNPGRTVGAVWDEAEIEWGWGTALSRNYGTVNNSNGDPWTADEAVPMQLGPADTLEGACGRYAGKVIFVWDGLQHQAYPVGGYGTDLATIAAPVRIVDADAVTSAPHDVDFEPVASHVRVIGAKGRVWTFPNPDPDLLVTMHGSAEIITVQARDILTEDEAERVALAKFETAVVSELNTRAQRFDQARVRPFEHYNLYDRAKFERGRIVEGGKLKVDEINADVAQITVIVDGSGAYGHVDAGLRTRGLGERMVRQMGSVTSGSDVRYGLVPPSGKDRRTPVITGEPSPTVTPTVIPDRGNRPAGRIEITQLWDTQIPALEPDGTTSLTSIKILWWIYATRRAGKKWKEQLRVSADDTSNVARIEQLFEQDETIQIRRAAESHDGVLSAWQTLTDVTWTEDFDASAGPDLIVDGGHVQGGIRSTRATDAGAGFAFELVSGEYVAAFSSTTPVLDYGVAGRQKSGRARVKPGDEVTVSMEALRAASTSAATLLAQVRWFNNDGTTLSTVTSISQAVTSSYVKYTGTALVAPAGAATFSLRVKASALTGVKMRVRNVVADRRTVADRMADDAVLGRVIHATDNLAVKHTSTAALFQAASGSSGWKGGTTGLFWYTAGGVAAFSATAAGVFVIGTLTTGSGMIVGGAGLFDLQFPSGSGYAIGESGGFLEYKAGGSGHKFTGAVLVGSALTVSGSAAFNGTRVTNTGGLDANGSGTTLGFYGVTAVTRQTVTGSRGGNAALADLLTKLALKGLIVDGSSV